MYILIVSRIFIYITSNPFISPTNNPLFIFFLHFNNKTANNFHSIYYDEVSSFAFYSSKTLVFFSHIFSFLYPSFWMTVKFKCHLLVNFFVFQSFFFTPRSVLCYHHEMGTSYIIIHIVIVGVFFDTLIQAVKKQH